MIGPFTNDFVGGVLLAFIIELVSIMATFIVMIVRQRNDGPGPPRDWEPPKGKPSGGDHLDPPRPDRDVWNNKPLFLPDDFVTEEEKTWRERV